MNRSKLETADLKLEKLTKKFGTVTAVNAVSLDIPHAKLLTLLGPSGCGKTTILRMIAGLEVPTSGAIYLGGKNVTNLPPNERKITMVFQSYALFPHMNVYENIAYGLRVMRWPEEKIREAVREALHMVGLEGLQQRSAHELSGGQQQRVAVARALILKPKVLLFDEPLSNLDAKLRKRMRGEIRNLQRDLEITTVYVTHDQSEALAISDQVVVMENAVISHQGTPSELYTRPANPFVADFIGEANIIDVKILESNKDKALVQLGSARFSVPFLNKPAKGARAKLMIRPEDIRMGLKGEGELQGVVKFAMYQGATNDYIVDTEVGEIGVIDYQSDRIMRERGAEISLKFREDRALIIP